MSELIFFLSWLLRSVLTKSIKSFKSFVCLADYYFIAYLLPARTLSNTSYTLQVHQIWVPEIAIIPKFYKTQATLYCWPYLNTASFIILWRVLFIYSSTFVIQIYTGLSSGLTISFKLNFYPSSDYIPWTCLLFDMINSLQLSKSFNICGWTASGSEEPKIDNKSSSDRK